MLETIANIKFKIDKWESQWLLPNDTPLDVCDEFYIQYGKYLAAVREHAKSMAEQAKQESESSQEELILEEAHVD